VYAFVNSENMMTDKIYTFIIIEK